jgi:hypothetical protein
MGFLLPVAFSLLGLLAILIAFYLFKKKFERKVVSSTYLWEQIMKEWETNRWNKKLNQNLLFFLQLLIMIAIVIAIARPYMDGENVVTSEQLVIIMDTSATMVAMDDDTTRFELAKEQAIKMVKQLNKNQTVTLVNAKSTPELLLTNEANQRKVIDTINDLKLSYEADNLIDSIKLGESLIHQQSAEIHLFSDHTKKDDVETVPIDHNLVVHNVGITRPNLSLRSFGVKKAMDQVNGVITVFNEGDKEESVSLLINSENKELVQLNETLPPNKLTVIEFANLPVETVYEAKIEQGDGYSLDDQSYAFLANNESPSIHAAGEVNQFVIKVVQALGSEVVSVKGNNFPKKSSNSINILSNFDTENWPDGPKLVFSPSIGGPFQIKEKRDLEFVLNGKSDPLLRYVDTDKLYLAKSYPIGDIKDLEPVVISGDEVVVAKGKFKKDLIVLFAFDIEDSDWPLHPSFPVLLNNTLQYLKPTEAYLGRFLPGNSTEVTYSPTTTSAYIEASDGFKLRNINTKEALQVPVVPGLYQLHEKMDAGLQSRFLAVEIADSERDTSVEKSFSLIVNETNVKNGSIVSNEIWHWVALFALVVLFLEWEVYRRGIRGR